MSRADRTKDLEFSPKVRKIIFDRDGGCCVNCGSPDAHPNAHYIPRSQGGLGIEENGLTLCFDCHYLYDHTTERKNMKEKFREYLQECYPEWDEKSLCYRKFAAYKEII